MRKAILQSTSGRAKARDLMGWGTPLEKAEGLG